MDAQAREQVIRDLEFNDPADGLIQIIVYLMQSIHFVNTQGFENQLVFQKGKVQVAVDIERKETDITFFSKPEEKTVSVCVRYDDYLRKRGNKR